MMGLCPECAHILYGYPNCAHHFHDGRCVNCYWDGSKSVYIKKLNQQEETDMPTTEWLNKYEAIKDRLTCKDDLEAHFTAVSYTHLVFPPCTVLPELRPEDVDEGLLHFACYVAVCCTMYGPVSYTHLDVYKRQPWQSVSGICN